jgi:hypothetical protein
MIKSRMRWVVHVAHIGENRNEYRVLVEKIVRKEQLNVHKKIILK